MFGEGSTHGSPSSSQYVPRDHAGIATTSSFAPMPKCLVEQPRELADRHAVAHRDRVLTDEGFEACFEHRAFDGHAADRIRAVAHDHGRS